MSASYSYDQAEVLSQTILRHAKEVDARSLMDIGAGAGAVARVVSRDLARYLAVEQNPTSVAALRKAGVAVLSATFPCEVPGRPFDMVVSSHSIPEGSVEMYEPFLAQAWAAVKPGGLFLVITFKGPVESPIRKMAAEILDRRYGDDLRYAEMLRLLGSYGTVAISVVTSHVRTLNFSDLEARFGGWFWKSQEQRAIALPRLRDAMDSKFRSSSGEYDLTTPHTVIAVRRAEA
jgi:cyclopropane fatty-acyl-phospholipid synthase-like methyltransferase